MNISAHLLGLGFTAMVLLALVLLILICALIRWIWNTTISALFGLRHLTLWESFKIFLFCAVLFGGLSFPFVFYVSETSQKGTGSETVVYGIGPYKK